MGSFDTKSMLLSTFPLKKTLISMFVNTKDLCLPTYLRMFYRRVVSVNQTMAYLRQNDTQAAATPETADIRHFHGEHGLKGSPPSKANH